MAAGGACTLPGVASLKEEKKRKDKKRKQNKTKNKSTPFGVC